MALSGKKGNVGVQAGVEIVDGVEVGFGQFHRRELSASKQTSGLT